MTTRRDNDNDYICSEHKMVCNMMNWVYPVVSFLTMLCISIVLFLYSSNKDRILADEAKMESLVKTDKELQAEISKNQLEVMKTLAEIKILLAKKNSTSGGN